MTPERSLALLRRFEPVVRYTRGEKFFPTDVAPYVAACSLWVQRLNEEPLCLIPDGALTLGRLSEPRPDEFGALHYLKFVNPLSVPELAAYTLRESGVFKTAQERFQAGRGRLARVGYTSRLVDALFSLTLLARGRVPGDTAAAAALAYRRMLGHAPRACYYGRVVQEAGWTVLQYWFFYPFNDWRSGFFGANDHEADWEMLCLYLSDDATGDLHPEWVAYASHDHVGDDLRRRWDDPEVAKVGEHPVLFAAAGSHASYYIPGEYLTEIDIPFLAPLVAATERTEAFWHRTLRQYRVETTPQQEEAASIFRIPFVDYARGDGLAIGPGQAWEWETPYLLDEPPAWVTRYRGLWGLFTHDPFAGENAPAGPMYNRDGSVRRSWYDPVGWAGLDKVPPRDEALATVLVQQGELAQAQAQLRASVEEKSLALRGLGVEAAAMRGQPHLSQLYAAHARQIATLSQEVDGLRVKLAINEAMLGSLGDYAARLRAGEPGELRAHIRRAHRPASAANLRASRLAEAWAAASVGLSLIGFVTLILLSHEYLFVGVGAILALLLFIEAVFRGQIISLVTSATVGLAILAALVLLFEFFWEIVILSVLFMGGYLLWGNLQELRQ